MTKTTPTTTVLTAVFLKSIYTFLMTIHIPKVYILVYAKQIQLIKIYTTMISALSFVKIKTLAEIFKVISVSVTRREYIKLVLFISEGQESELECL